MQHTLWNEEQQVRTSDDYYTPKWIFDALGVTFDLDVASPPEGPPHTPTRAYYSLKDDGLTAPWHGLVWMNPPFSKPGPWVDRFIEHDNGIALLPFSNGKWMHNIWNTELTVMRLHAIKFDRPNETKPIPVSFSLALWAAGPTAKQALHNSGLGKVR